MKLILEGSVQELGRYAKLDHVFELTDQAVGHQQSFGLPAMAVEIEEFEPGKVTFILHRDLNKDEIVLKLGESKGFSGGGNAYGYEMTFTLVE